MPALPSRKKRKLANNNARGARLTQTDLDEIAAPSNHSSLTNKYNLKYEPDDPNLTEEQRAEWRKEQRKARNRASAAASRLKTKARIDELEGEVGELRRMYAAAVARIAELENGGGGASTLTSTTGSFAPDIGRTASTTISPPSSPPPLPHYENHHHDMPEMPPLDLHVAEHDSPISGTPRTYDPRGDDDHAEKQHVIETTSLPAV